MTMGPNETVKERYDTAIRWLRDLSQGQAELGGAAAPTGTSVGHPVQDPE